ncbi:MAG: hypothetical protein IJJ25_11075, partial [Lachnospiraceae bacterium]|nr:hypothetical protein [Lachnospiraceae bacterium]
VKAKPPDGGGWLAADSAQLARGIWKYPLYIFTFEGSLQMCEKNLTLPYNTGIITFVSQFCQICQDNFIL